MPLTKSSRSPSSSSAVCPKRVMIHVAASVKTSRMLDRVERNQAAVRNHRGAQPVDLGLRTVAPVHVLRPGESGNFMDPGPKRRIGHPNARGRQPVRTASTARYGSDRNAETM